MTIKTDSYIIGSNVDDTRNFLLDTDLAGALRIRRKSDGSGGLLATFDSSGNLQLGAAANANAGRLIAITKPTTSGANIDFLPADGFPTWAKKITALINGVSTNGTNALMMQFGSGSFANTGYSSQSAMTSGSGVVTSGLLLTSTTAAANAWCGSGVFGLSGSEWVGSGTLAIISSTSTAILFGGKSPSFGTAIDRLRFTTQGSTDLFDAGSVTLLIEG